jgi:hypothetical protein
MVKIYIKLLTLTLANFLGFILFMYFDSGFNPYFIYVLFGFIQVFVLFFFAPILFLCLGISILVVWFNLNKAVNKVNFALLVFVFFVLGFIKVSYFNIGILLFNPNLEIKSGEFIDNSNTKNMQLDDLKFY